MTQPHSLRRLAAFAALLALAACGDDATAPTDPALSLLRKDTLAAQVRQLAAGRGIVALKRPRPVRRELVRLGQALAFDRILSGNRDISCMTCHLPRFATGDTRSLSIGQGAKGLGPDRTHPRGAFIPRNAPPLFNLHALDKLFWDGRVFRDGAGQFHTRQATSSLPT